MIYKIIIFLFFIFSINNSNSSEKIEDTVATKLKEIYKDEHILSSSELGFDLRKYFNKVHPRQTPGLVCDYFRNKNIKDCFVLLADSISNVKRLVVIVNLNSKSLNITEIPIFLSTSYKNNNLFIRFFPKKKIFSKNSDLINSKIMMINNGIELKYYEKSSTVIFFDNAAYVKVLIED